MSSQLQSCEAFKEELLVQLAIEITELAICMDRPGAGRGYAGGANGGGFGGGNQPSVGFAAGSGPQQHAYGSYSTSEAGYASSGYSAGAPRPSFDNNIGLPRPTAQPHNSYSSYTAQPGPQSIGATQHARQGVYPATAAPQSNFSQQQQAGYYVRPMMPHNSNIRAPISGPSSSGAQSAPSSLSSYGPRPPQVPPSQQARGPAISNSNGGAIMLQTYSSSSYYSGPHGGGGGGAPPVPPAAVMEQTMLPRPPAHSALNMAAAAAPASGASTSSPASAAAAAPSDTAVIRSGFVPMRDSQDGVGLTSDYIDVLGHLQKARVTSSASFSSSSAAAKGVSAFEMDAKSISSGTYPLLDPVARNTWEWPTSEDYPDRAYQLEIVSVALFQNTLVSLPTGMGKTFIAAVVMHNYFRWFPTGQVVFLAPTRPLVTQQIEACYRVVGMPERCTAQMQGTTSVSKRGELWRDRRVFYCTPQTFENDLKSGRAAAKRVVLVVVDEAHRATQNHSYVKCMQALDAGGGRYRVLALSATPGSDLNKVRALMPTTNQQAQWLLL